MSRGAAPSRSGPATGKRVLWVTLLAIGFTLALKLPTLRLPHDEPDEVVYWSVAERLLTHGEYTLRGAAILPSLSPRIYDRPLFHHPPLFVVLLVPFVVAGSPSGAIAVSWLGHVLVVVAVGVFAHARSRDPDGAAVAGFAWLPLVAAATDPLLTFVSRKLWIDSLMAGLAALALALVYLALRSPRRARLLVAGGLVLGLAGLAKVPALLVAPVAALFVWCDGGPVRRRIGEVALVAVPALVLTVPWFVSFHAAYGVLTPQWLKPDAYALLHYPFVARAVARPWYYYVVKLCIAYPLLVATAVLAVPAFRERRPAATWLPWIWLLWILGVTTVQGVTGYGFQMRYVVPVVPALYVAMLGEARLAAAADSWWGRPAAVLAIAYGAMEGVFYLFTPRFDEFFSLPELARLLLDTAG